MSEVPAREAALKKLEWYIAGARFAYVAAGGVGISSKAIEEWISNQPKDFVLNHQQRSQRAGC